MLPMCNACTACTCTHPQSQRCARSDPVTYRERVDPRLRRCCRCATRAKFLIRNVCTTSGVPFGCACAARSLCAEVRGGIFDM